MSELVSKFPKTMITGDDLTVTSKDILKKAIENNIIEYDGSSEAIREYNFEEPQNNKAFLIR